MKLTNNGFAATLLSALLLAGAAGAETAWVSDQFEITLRSGPSTSNAIERMLNSGTRLEILETDPESGYSRVRTSGGTEGYVLTRYLMNEPAAREQLASLTNQLTSGVARQFPEQSALGHPLATRLGDPPNRDAGARES